MGSVLDRAVRLHENRTAIIHEAGQYTWGEFSSRIHRAAGVLAFLGVKKGDRFGIVCRNSFRQAELIYAGFIMGAIPVPINYRLAEPEIRFILDDSSCKILIVEDKFSDLLNAEDLRPWADKSLYLSAETADVPWHQYEALLEQAAPLSGHDSAEGDDAVLLYTGGTTGRSKGVRLSHRNIALNGLQISATMAPCMNDRFLHVAPMFHSADFVGTAYTHVGAAHVYLPQPSGLAILEAIEKYQITATMIPPTLIIATLQEEGFDNFDLSSLRQFVFGSAPTAPKWVRAALEKFPSTDIWHGYGLTETSPMVTLSQVERSGCSNASGYIERWSSAGQTVPGTDLRIVDDAGLEVSTGQIAEVAVRGPQIFKGYLNMPEQTAEAFKDGWFYTGDVGKIDKEGYLFLLDRKKDMVITGGENVYTAEVEAAVCLHPQVLEAAVFGVADELYGEALVAAIVARADASLCEDDIITHCRDFIGGYKIPRKVLFIPELPKNTIGKVLKNELRESYAGLQIHPNI